MSSAFALVLAALSALVWGTGDFSGGKASQRANALAVTVVSQLFGLPILALTVLVFAHGGPTGASLGYGAIAGAAGFAGILLLYMGLSKGAMAIFAPVSAVTGALIPLVVGLLTEQAPSSLALTGAGCAIVAIGLVSASGHRSGGVSIRLIGLAMASGAMFGIFFAVLGQLGPDAGVWPSVGVRIGSLSVGLAAVAVTRTPLRIPRGPLGWTISAGVLDLIANVLYIVAVGNGKLSIIAPVSALYPVSTVLLALMVDREKVRPVQLCGLGLAATALVLVAT